MGDLIVKNVSQSSQENDIEEFVEYMEKYVPGHCVGNEYLSEHFGFKFTIDENWELYPDEELKSASEAVKTSATKSALAALEKENVPLELQGKIKEAIYAETEFGALFIADDMYVGEVIVGVMSAYGVEDEYVEDYVDEIKNSISPNTQVTDAHLAGVAYKVLSAKINDVNNGNIAIKMYVTIKNNMFCTITCKAMEGYEEQVFKAFEDGMSVYKYVFDIGMQQ